MEDPIRQTADRMEYPIRRIAVLIPAYRPDERLIALAAELSVAGYGEILVVDDGSGAAYRGVFDRLPPYCRVLRHAVNLGKGRALKTGLNDILCRENIAGIVTADADGQHLPADILRVAQALCAYPDNLILGARAFVGKVPKKSRVGNRVTSLLYRVATGVRVSDTQTGLRGIPAAAARYYLTLPGERYELEMNMLMVCERIDCYPLEVPIETVYIDDNRGSHFRPLQDGLRIGRILFGFMASSLCSFLLDYALFALLLGYTRDWSLSFVLARLVSSFVNFTLNYNAVFRSKVPWGRAMARYYLLAACIFAIAYGLMHVLVEVLDWNELASKVLVDAALYAISFLVQREFIYRKKKRAR